MKFIFLGFIGWALIAPARSEPWSPGQVEEKRAAIRANFFIPQPLPGLAPKVHRRWSPAPGVTAEAVSYATEFGLRVPAIVYLPDPVPAKKALPGLIIVPGHGGDKYSWYSYYAGIAYARAGAAVLTYDPAGEGERSATRKSATREHDRLAGDEGMARRLAGLMITDVSQGVSYLASRPEVDPGRIGAAGYSLGSFVVALAGAIEPRLKVCVLVGGGNLDGPEGRWDKSKPMCQGLPYRSLGFLGDRPAALYALQAARGPVLIWNGRADTLVNITAMQEPFFDDLRERTAKLLGREAGLFEFGFDPTGSHRPYFLGRPVALWLERQLDFPAWTEASIRQLPETHASEWITRHHIAIESTYLTEELEGGLRAIGGDVPGFARESLDVYSLAEWELGRPQFTFESWIAAATAAERRERSLPANKTR